MAAENALKQKPPQPGFIFNVPQPDGTVGRVTVFTDADRVIHTIVNGELLLPILQPTSRAPSIPSVMGAQSPLRGVRLDDNGSVQADDITKRNVQLFVKEIPCWFDGCEELRERYERDVVAETADWMRRHPGKDCPGCVTGRVNTKYLEIMRDMNTEKA